MNFFQRLFSQPKVDNRQPDPPPADDSVAPPDDPPAVQRDSALVVNITHLPPGLHVGKFSDVGKVRERNEDFLFTISSLMHHPYGQEPFGIFIVADGMGGHEKGDVASLVAAQTTAGFLLEEIYLPALKYNDKNSSNRPVKEVLVSAVEAANSQVIKAVPEGGTTLTGALLLGNSAYIAHVGDTRAYFFKENSLKQVTEDHSLAQRLRETGQATPAQIAQIDNVLYRAIGQGEPIEVDTHVQHLPPGSSLLLCSDGLWKGIDDDEVIRETVNGSASPQEACEKLVALANDNGGEDNITIVIISMGAEVETPT